MAESKVIELKGITRNLTKIGVQDGQCDDLVNLRLKDGSWRVSCDGKYVHTLPNDYEQLYVHTNVYHHLLGVLNGKLWYFADIDNDGETFTPLDTPVEICDVQGEVTIVQNGHLLTIISILSQSTPSASATSDDGRSINYVIFRTNEGYYHNIKSNPNGEKTDRWLYPFSEVHLNLYSGSYMEDGNKLVINSHSITTELSDSINVTEDGVLNTSDTIYRDVDVWKADMVKLFNYAKSKNFFTRPFLALVAVRLYDDTYAYACPPTLLFPYEKFAMYENAYDAGEETLKDISNYTGGFIVGKGGELDVFDYGNYVYREGATTDIIKCGIEMLGDDRYRLYLKRSSQYRSNILATTQNPAKSMVSQIDFSKLVLSAGDLTTISNNSDIFKGIAIFVTPEVDIYDIGDKKGEVITKTGVINNEGYACITYSPVCRRYNDIIEELTSSPFYLLREYKIDELENINNKNFVVDIYGDKYSGLLDNITNQTPFESLSLNRMSYTPKIAYLYNQKLHIANYNSNMFYGYPIDYFHLNNKTIDIYEGNYGGIQINGFEGSYLQYPRTKINFLSNVSNDAIEQYLTAAKEFGTCFAAISVTIETQQGEQRVVRYIAPYDSTTITTHSSFIESLGALLTYPDARAKTMTVMVVTFHEGEVIRRVQAFPLKPHPYLNLAYYIDPELKPITLPVAAGSNNISLENFLIAGGGELFLPPQEANATESFPNGLKVSLANNPFTFPYETTYQVGSAEIVALMSNAVAVGTGQTGAAPLYVFCKDGVYALLVDSSGEMTYTNARIIARDVCNNAQSVTPIDSGVVFTTDRGLMSIAGNEVIELGQAAEGEVFDITDSSLTISNPDAADKAKKIMFNSFTYQQLGELPQELLDNVDFLTYLKGSIVNYNHNERELMVSNPEYPYTYIMDRYGNWSRRDYKADEYLNNYPTSYRVNEGSLYKVDAGDSVRGNCYMLSNVIKLGTVSFKQAMRLVVRGYFEVKKDTVLGCYIFGSYDGRQWSMLGGNEKQGSFTDIGCDIHHTDVKFLRLCIAGQLSGNSRLDFIELSYDNSQLNTKLR